MKQPLRVSAGWAERLSRSVLRHRDLRVLVAGRALSFLGDQVAVVALVLAAHGRGWGTTAVAAMFAASALPLALGAPLAGRIVDRHDSRTVTVAAAGWQAACAAGLAAVLLVDPGGIGHGALLAAVLVLLLALNAGQAVAGPAWQALVPHAVPAADVGRAVGTLQAVTMLAAVAGPAVGGLLTAWPGPAAALALDAVTFVLLAVAATRVRARRLADRATRAGAAAASPGSTGWFAGVTRLRSDPLLGPLVLALLAVVLSVQLVVVVEVFLVRDVLGAGPAGYGAVGAVLALAMVAGSVAGGRVQGPGRRGGAALVGLGVIALAVLAGGLAPSLAAFAGAMAVLGAGNGVLNVALSALVLERVPDAEMGRALAVLNGGVQSCTVLGMAAGGLAGALASPRAVFVGAGIVGLGVWLAAVRALGPALAAAAGGGSQPRPVRPERGLRRAMATVRAVAKAHQAG